MTVLEYALIWICFMETIQLYLWYKCENRNREIHSLWVNFQEREQVLFEWARLDRPSYLRATEAYKKGLEAGRASILPPDPDPQAKHT